MTLQELVAFQEDFDSRHKGYFRWNSPITNDNIALGDCFLEEKKSELREEIADIFIYLLKMSYQLNIDLEKAYLEKMKKNQERFQRYEKQSEEITSK